MNGSACAFCGFNQGTVTKACAPLHIRRSLDELCELLANATRSDSWSRGSDGGWNAAEYAGHVRDVLIAQRERLLRARFEDEPTASPIHRDERVDAGEYHGCTLSEFATDIAIAGKWLLHTLRQFDRATWHRRMIYGYPEEESRDALWVVAHTIHELVHHTLDIRLRLPRTGAS